jgi:peptidoglycan/LPS O-acetylase OafA/YrhL
MFFVLSGFLITTLLLRERDRRSDISLRAFYLRRSLRIFPVYYAVLAALTLFYSVRPGGNSAPGFFHDLPYLVTYTSNWIVPTSIMAIAWSLAVEEQFYLLWPPIEKWLSRWTGAILVGLLAISVLTAAHLLDRWVPPGVAWVIGHVILFTPICLGVALAHLLHSPRGFRGVARFFSSPWAPAAVLGVLFIDLWYAPKDITGWPRLGIHVLMTAFLASCVIRDRHWLSPVLDNRLMRRVGVVSYGIYLYHMMGIHAAGAILRCGYISFTFDLFWIGFLITWCMAELSYRFFERPFLRLKEALSWRHLPSAVPDLTPQSEDPTGLAEIDAVLVGTPLPERA